MLDKFKKPPKRHEYFPHQRENEHIVLFLRRHWMIAAAYVARLIIFGCMPIVVGGLLYSLGWSLEMKSVWYVLAIEGISLYYICIWVFYFHEFVDYYLDVWIVTDQRIISIEQIGLFNYSTSEQSILKVQDVTAEIKGKRQTFLDYGHVHIQSAGEAERFVFEQVPHPREVARIIMQTQEDALRREGLSASTEEINVLPATQTKRYAAEEQIIQHR